MEGIFCGTDFAPAKFRFVADAIFTCLYGTPAYLHVLASTLSIVSADLKRGGVRRILSLLYAS